MPPRISVIKRTNMERKADFSSRRRHATRKDDDALGYVLLF